ncbi:hypothetical protein CRM94_17130 [Burkholderia gladioli]|uniref:HD domain-containing protein n=2 Tax=Burkholderia gladioli TaxID=28095 RepID=A0A2A7SAE4_BURGA|nr:hypothetical protein CRM94_17130 [Burkholderia gladioli]
MHREPLVAATTFVVTFWLAVVTILGVLHGQVRPTDLLSLTYWGIPLIAPAAALVGGILVSVLSIWLHRRYTFESLRPHQLGGMTTNMGRVPIILEPLPSSKQRVGSDVLRIPAALANVIIKRPVLPDDFLEAWYQRYQKSYPAHAALMQRIERVLMQHAHFPATHVQDGPRNHGGRSLVEHSLLVAMLMEWNAPEFKYPVDPSRPHLPLLDPNYEFNPVDPLIAIAGLAHDIGKIESYEFAPDDPEKLRPPIGSRIDHDKIGARVLARMDEFWDLPGDDREVLQLTCAYYHTPHAMPMGSPKTVRSDRLHAITELLIKWDSEGSALENKQGPEIADQYPLRPAALEPDPASNTDAKRMKSRGSARGLGVPGAAVVPAMPVSGDATTSNVRGAQSDAGQQIVLWEVIRSILLEPGRINGKDTRRNMGWKFSFPHLGGRTLIFLVEDSFTKLVAARGDLESEMGGTFSGPTVDPLTRRILRTCFEQGALFLDYEDARTRSPEMLVYALRLYMPSRYFVNEKTRTELNAPGNRGDHKSLASVLVLEATATILPELLKLPDNNRVPHIHHFRVGSAGRRGRPRKGSGAGVTTSGATTSPNIPADTGGWAIPTTDDIASDEHDLPREGDRVDEFHDEGLEEGPVIASRAAVAHTAGAATSVTGPLPMGTFALSPASISVNPPKRRAISTTMLAQVARAAASREQGVAAASRDDQVIIHATHPRVVEALSLVDFGYREVDSLLADIRAGEIPDTEVIEFEGKPLIRVRTASQAT